MPKNSGTNRSPLSPRPALQTLSPAIHGARNHLELATLQLDPEQIIDFSTNANPYGPAPTVLQAVQAAITTETVAPYPDRHCLALRQAIATAENTPTESVLLGNILPGDILPGAILPGDILPGDILPGDILPDNILPGNGSAELIQAIALAFVRPGSHHLILAPTFGEYDRAIQLMAGVVHHYRPAGPDYRFKLADTKQAIAAQQPDSVWLCNPNNPTGQQWGAAELAELQTAAPQALWVIDEAYRHFPARPVSAPADRPNQIILRSLTKDHALAGLRLGYAMARPALLEPLQQVQIPWSVSSLAQVAGVAALQAAGTAWREQTLAQLRDHARQLWADLTALGLKVLPTDTTFALVEVADPPLYRRRLLQDHLLVRDATSFGLPQHLRIAARLPEENGKLVETMARISGPH